MSEPNLQSVAFPVLDEQQIRDFAEHTDAQPRRLRDGELLFRTGQQNINFFIVKSGQVEIIDYTGDAPRTVTVHRPGEFTGDISHLTGRGVPVSGVARGDCEVYEIA